ncbi:MAG: ABC transporter permease [Deltaproteobacteria bacterium]|nr:MAG: ABC transporter permease [Deltaproteobacteria bacterium]
MVPRRPFDGGTFPNRRGRRAGQHPPFRRHHRRLSRHHPGQPGNGTEDDYLVLSKPVPRWEFVLGKAAGLCSTILLTTSVMAVTLFVVYAAYSGKAEPGILVASAGVYLELVLLVCLATLFSTFTTPTLSAMFTLALFLIGHLSQTLFVLGGRAKSAVARAAASFLFYLLPNLEIFNWKNGVVYGDIRSPAILLPAVGYLVCYGAAVLLLACLLFSRKDFK